VRFIYVFIYYENHTQITVIKKTRQEIHRLTLMPTAHAGRPLHSLRSLYAATPALPATVESLATDVRYRYVSLLSLNIQQVAHCFHGVVGLVVLCMSVVSHLQILAQFLCRLQTVTLFMFTNTTAATMLTSQARGSEGVGACTPGLEY